MSRLQELVIELADRCPLSCRHCSSCSGPARMAALDWDTVNRVLVEGASLGATQVSFGGGEPTAASLFLRTLRESLGMGLRAEIFTCGIRFDDAGSLTSFSNGFLRELAVLRGEITFVFSFHGSCSSVHDAITAVEGSYELMIDSLRRCLAAGISCTANFVPTRVNACDLQNLVNTLEGLGIPKLSVLRFVPQGRGLANRATLELTREEEDSFVEEILDLRTRTSVAIRTGSPFNGIVPDNNVPCRAGMQKVVIQANGNVLPCEVFKHKERSDWGASVHTASLKSILASPQFATLRKVLHEGRCAACPVHGILRANQPVTGVHHGVSKTAV